MTMAPFWRTLAGMKHVAWAGAVVVALGAWSGGAVAQTGSATATPGDGAAYTVRLKDLQERVELLHEQVRRMQQRQKLLGAAPMAGTVQAAIDVRDLTTSTFVLTGMKVWLDGQLVYERAEDGVPLGDRAVTAFRGGVSPGEHVVRVSVDLAGNSALLPYMKAYRFEVHDERRFVATEGYPESVTVGAFERGDVTTPLEQRPAVSWEILPR
jgi:hypothetical protein